MDLLDDTLSANGVDLAGFDDVETAVAIVVVVRQTGKRGTNARVNVGVVAEEAFLSGVVEVCSVCDCQLRSKPIHWESKAYG